MEESGEGFGGGVHTEGWRDDDDGDGGGGGWVSFEDGKGYLDDGFFFFVRSRRCVGRCVDWAKEGEGEEEVK